MNIPKSPEQRILELEAKVRLLEKQKAQLERQNYITDQKAVIFDMMIYIAEKDGVARAIQHRYKKKLTTRTIREYSQKQEESISFSCGLFGTNRQVYYRSIKRTQKRKTIAQQVVDLVNGERQKLPRLGTRKLYVLLYRQLEELKVGRDKFFDILRANHLLIKPKRSYNITTWSHHRFRKHSNLIKEMAIIEPEQVWVSDITYIGKREKPCYLSLITDAYSKKIVGYEVADSLSTDSCLKALKMAQKNRVHKNKCLIHHSDRGVQYCSDEYQSLLSKYKIRCSMTQDPDPYENAVAERINGILKQEFMIDNYHLELTLMKKNVSESKPTLYSSFTFS